MPITISRLRSFLDDADGDGVADSGDTFLHTITITNTEALALTNLFLDEEQNGLTIDPGSVNIGPVAIDEDLNDIFGTIQGNTPIKFAASDLLANDLDQDGSTSGLKVTKIGTTAVVDADGDYIAVSNIAVSNGTVSSNGDGTFTFRPNVGFEGEAGFTYEATDADGVSSVAATPGAVSITVSDPVWYIDSLNGSDAIGNGTLENPFATLAPVNTGGNYDSGATGDDDGDIIFVYNRGTNNGSIALEDGQSLLGDGSSLTSVNGNDVGASTANSDIGGGLSGIIVTLAQNNTISGIDILGNGTATGVSGSSFGTLNVSSSTIDTAGGAIFLNGGTVAGSGFTSTSSGGGGTFNVQLNGVNGALGLGSGSLADGGGGSAVSIVGGSVNLTYDGSITQSKDAAALSVSGHNGTVNLDGSISATGGSGLVFNNAGGTYNLTGVIDLSGGTGAAGIQITNGSSGTFTFGTAANLATVTHTGVGDAFRVDQSNANVTFNGNITDANGNAVNIANHDGGTITFQNGSISSTGASAGGIEVVNSNAGSINFNGAVNLSTQDNAAVILIDNGGSVINFSGAGNGLDIVTTDGTALAFIGTTATGSTAAGELNISGSSNTIATTSGKMIDIANGTTGTGLNFNTLTQSGGTVSGHVVSLKNFDGDADANVEAFTANSISVAGTNSGGDGINISNGSSVKFDVNTVVVKNASGDGIELNGANGEVDIDTVNIQGVAGRGVHIVGATQLVDIDGGGIGVAVAPDATVDDPGQEGILINGGTGNIDIGANVAKTSTGNVVEVQNHTSGTINFTGTVAANGSLDNGILLNGNGGNIVFSGSSQSLFTSAFNGLTITGNTANIDFTGGNFDVNTSSGAGISAGTAATATGGTLTISGGGNSLTATTGHAILMNGTDSDGITFQTISKNGGPNTAVYLKDAGSGGFTVTGSGSTAGSGGALQNIAGTDANNATGIGVYVENTNGISLSNMLFGNGTTLGNYAIRGVNVDNFTLRDSVVNGTSGTTAAAENEAGISFTNLNGVGLFEGNNISGGFTDNMRIQNTENGQTLNLFVRDNATSGDQAVFGNTGETISANDALNVQVSNDGNVKMLVNSVQFTGWRGDGIQASAFDTANLDATVTNNTFTNGNNNIASAGGIGVLIGGTAGGGSWGVDYTVSGNTVTGSKGVAIAASFNGTSGTARGIIANNTVGTPGNGFDQSGSSEAAGIFASVERVDGGSGLLTHLTTISGNTIRDTKQTGIFVRAANGDNTTNNAIIEATINNNTIAEMGSISPATSIAGLLVQVSGAYDPSNNPQDFSLARLDINNNNINVNGTTGVYAPIYFDQVPGSQGAFQFPGYVGTDGSSYGGNNDDIRNYIVGRGNVLTNDDMPLTGVPAETVWAPDARMDPGTLQTAQTGSNTDLPTGAIQAAPTPAPTPPAATPAPYVDPTPQSGPVADPNPVKTDAGTGGGTTDTDTGSNTPPPAPPAPEAPQPLTQAALDTLVEAAIARWIDAGATPEQVAAMRATSFTLSDMSGTYLGTSTGGSVLVDSDGAGHGWFIDATPGEDGEYGGSGTRLTADAGGPAAGRMDLLTVLMHELGHQVGMDDNYNKNDADELMYGYARIGERRLPGADDLAGADMSHAGHESFLVLSPTIATLPAGKAVKVTYTSTVNSYSNEIVANDFSNTSTVDGDNFDAVESDAEALVVDTLTLGDRVYFDANNSGFYDDGEGRSGVVLNLYADDGTTAGVLDEEDSLLDTTVAGAGGLYSFTNLAEGDYIVQVGASNFGESGALENLVSAEGSADADDDATDGDDNGIAALEGSVASKAITLTFDGETTDDGTGQNDINDTLDFGFVDVNDAPVITAPDSATGDEDTAIAITGVSVADADIGSGELKVTISVAAGSLSVTAAGAAAVTDNGSNEIVVEGLLADVNSTLATLSFEAPADANGPYTITINANDNGYTGPDPGGVDPDSEEDEASVSITVNVVPDISDDELSDTEDSPGADITVFTNDEFEDDGASITSFTDPGHGSVTLMDNDTPLDPGDDYFFYKPDADYNGTDSFTYTVTAGGVEETATVNISLSAEVDIANDTHAISEDSGTATVDVLGNDDFDNEDAAITDVGSASHGTVTINDNGTDDDATDDFIEYTPDEDYNGTDSFTYTVTSGGLTEQATVNVTIGAVNDAPTVVNGTTDSLAAVEEDDTNPPGTLVSSLFGTHFSDAKDAAGESGANTFTGIAIVADASDSEGSWQYLDGGDWTDVPTVSVADAFILAPTDQLRFLPAANFNGAAPELTAHLIDSSAGFVTSGTTADLSTTGGSTPYSADTVAVSQTINPVNDLPELNGATTLTVDEQIAETLNATLDVADADLDGRNGGSGDYEGSFYTVQRSSGANAEDLFTLAGTDDFSVVGNELRVGTLVFGTIDTSTDGLFRVSFTSADTEATSALVDAVLQAIEYANSSDTPPEDVELVHYFSDGSPGAGQDDDGLAGTSTLFQTVTINALDDGPTLTATGLSPTYTEDAAAALLFDATAASTIEENQEFSSLTLTVTNVTDGAAEKLTFGDVEVALTDEASNTATNGAFAEVAVTGTTATVTITFAPTLSSDDLVSFVDSLAYRNTSQQPSDANRIFTIAELVDSGAQEGDNANTSTPNISSTVDVEPQNDAPVVSAAAAVSVDEQDTVAVVSGVTVSDPDLDARNDGNGDYAGAEFRINRNTSVSADDVFSVADGDNFSVDDDDNLIDGDGNIFGEIVISETGFLIVRFNSDEVAATSALVDEVIQSIQYRNTSDDPPATVELSYGLLDGSPDNGQGGGGESDIDGDVVTVTINPINDGPTNTPGDTIEIDEDEGAIALKGISVADPDAGSNPIGAAFGVLHGTLVVDETIAAANGIDSTEIVYTDDDRGVAIAGTVEEINALLAADGLSYTSDADYYGEDTLTILTDDAGNTGADRDESDGDISEQDIATRTINIAAVNDAVTSTAPATAETDEDVTLDITGLAIDDVDAVLEPDGLYGVTLSATNGTLTLTTRDDLNFSDGDGSDDTTMTFVGTLADINAALASAKFTPDAEYSGPAEIKIEVTDDVLGTIATGSGTASDDSDTIAVTVNVVDDPATAVDDAFTAVEDTAFTTGDLFANDSDIDGGADPVVLEVNGEQDNVGTTIMLPSGALLRVNSDGTFSYDPNGAFADLALFGSGASNTTGTDSFTYGLADGGGTATVIMTINGVYSVPHIMLGTDGKDFITGTALDDIFDPGAGADTMIGNGGDDLFNVDEEGDRVFADDGVDEVRSSISYEINARIENLTLTGNGAIDAVGNRLNNLLVGNSAANLLDGRGGNDTLRGGDGDDVYIVGGLGDTVIETHNGHGTDLVRSEVDFTLGNFVENLVLTGAGVVDGTGNSRANTIVGNRSANVLDGKGDADLLIGGAGDDVYIVDNPGDQVIELGSQGKDQVRSSVSYELGRSVERLQLTGSGSIDGNGNDADNIITGNSGANFLRGRAGDDVIDGGAGADSLAGGAGLDTLTGGTGKDRFYFDARLIEENVDNILDFKAADDTIYLNSSQFTRIADGTLSAAAFHTGSGATSDDHRIVYNAATGDLFYDRDGAGGADQILFAKLDSGLALTSADFVVFG